MNASRGALAVSVFAVAAMLGMFADAYRHASNPDPSHLVVPSVILLIAVVVAVIVVRTGRDSPSRTH